MRSTQFGHSSRDKRCSPASLCMVKVLEMKPISAARLPFAMTSSSHRVNTSAFRWASDDIGAFLVFADMILTKISARAEASVKLQAVGYEIWEEGG